MQTCILKETECLSSEVIAQNELLRLHILSFLFLTMQVLQVRIDFEMETCSCVKPSQAVQATTLNAVANHVRFFSSSST